MQLTRANDLLLADREAEVQGLQGLQAEQTRLKVKLAEVCDENAKLETQNGILVQQLAAEVAKDASKYIIGGKGTERGSERGGTLSRGV